MCGSCSRTLVCPTRHDHGDREQSPGTRRAVPQADTCTATRHDLARATSPAPGPHRPPSSARSPPVRPRRPLIQPAMRTVYSPHYLPTAPVAISRTVHCRSAHRDSSARFIETGKLAASHNGMTGYDSRSWVMLRIGRQAVQSHKRRSRSMKRIKFVGLDVHAETIAVAVAEQGGEVRPLGVIPNRVESIRKLVKKLGPVEQLRFCYEAGPTGYVVYWQLPALGTKCEVVAPTLVSVKSGERVKTDRRDALKLARNYRARELTPVWVPDAAHEALRDLVRAREAAKKDQLRAKHRLGKFLLRHGRRPPTGVKPWTLNYLSWVKHE